MIVYKCKELLYEDLEQQKKAMYFAQKYSASKDNYLMRNPSERMMLVNDYYSFDSLSEASTDDDD